MKLILKQIESHLYRIDRALAYGLSWGRHLASA